MVPLAACQSRVDGPMPRGLVEPSVLECLTHPPISLHIVLGDASALCLHHAKLDLTVVTTVLCSQTVQPSGFGIVLRNAFATFVHHAELYLCKCPCVDIILLASSESKPLQCFGIVLRNAVTQVVHRAEIDLV